jgi:MoaA/NifB/PqqE/SkfB family radical SAM enzyme
MKCSFCNVWKRNIFQNEGTTSDFKKRLYECWDLGCSVVSFTGGEPLLRDDLEKLMEFSSKKLGAFTGLVTNGLLLDKRINEIKKYADFLGVSFDANNRQIYNNTRGVDALKKVKRNIKLAKSIGVDVNLFSVITKETFDYIDDTIEFAKSLEIPIHFSSVDNVPREFMETSEAYNLKIDETSQVFEKLVIEKKKYKKIHFERDYFKFQSLGGFNKFITCSSASTTLSLKPDASVALPCPFFTLIKIEKNQSLKNGLNTEKVKKIVDDCGKWDFCYNCSINCMYVVSLVHHPYLLIRWIQDKL